MAAPTTRLIIRKTQTKSQVHQSGIDSIKWFKTVVSFTDSSSYSYESESLEYSGSDSKDSNSSSSSYEEEEDLSEKKLLKSAAAEGARRKSRNKKLGGTKGEESGGLRTLKDVVAVEGTKRKKPSSISSDHQNSISSPTPTWEEVTNELDSKGCSKLLSLHSQLHVSLLNLSSYRSFWIWERFNICSYRWWQ